MKVKELIEQLQKLDGELTVYVEADHGQTPEQCSGALEYYNKDTENNHNPYYLESAMPVDLDEGETHEEDWCFEGDISKLDKHVIVFA
jgi:hypothetical protein